MIDFLCIGAQKSGTTWLMSNLEQHPEIWLPFIKEVHYFDVIHLDFPAEYLFTSFQQRITELRSQPDFDEHKKYYERILDEQFRFTDEWYKHIFSAAPIGKIKGEITPYYSSLNLAGISHVRRLAPDVKIIYLIRDPVERAKSLLKMALSIDPQQSQVVFCRSESFKSRGDYKNNIPRWESCFEKGNILYIPFGRIGSNPRGVMNEIEDFLGVSYHEDYPSLSKRIFSSQDHRIDEEALNVITVNAVEQNRFLKERFGTDFFGETK